MSWTGIGKAGGVWVVLGLWAIAAGGAPADKETTPELDVPYVPTHETAVEAMLKLAKVTGEDFVMDLGCGDGRIVVTAAKKHKARGLGVDLDPKRVRESNENARKAGVTKRVTFRKADIMDTDCRQATVVTLFLLESVNVKLRPKLFAELKPGTRVVSNGFNMRQWKPDKVLRHRQAYNRVMYFWAIPAPVGGTWRWQTKLPGKQVANSLTLTQQFQAVRGVVSFPDAKPAPIAEASLAGKALTFTATVHMGNENVKVTYRGTVEGDALRGTQKWAGGPNAGTYPWLAKRDPADLAGRWQVRAPRHADHNGTLHVERQAGGLIKASYVRDKAPTKTLPVPAFYAWGTSVRFEVPTDRLALVYTGTLGPDAGGGTVAEDESKRSAPWSAKRLPAAPKK